jgi:uncharacterized protein YjhX (UPF0386 family)
MKEKRPLNPNEAFRRSQKKQVKKLKVERRTQRVKQIPLDRRDPNQLIASIQKYNILDYEGKLTGDGRMHKKRLIDQFNSLKKARAVHSSMSKPLATIFLLACWNGNDRPS